VIREITGTKDQSVPAIDCAAKYLNLVTHSLAIKKLEWLGMFDESAPPIEQGSMRDIVSALYGEKLVFSEGERDLVVMQHRLGVSYPGNSRKTHISTLVSRGDFDTESAIAKTTGLPIGIAAHLIVIGAIKRTGVVIPTTEDIYIPSMKELSVEGICFTEETIDRN
jgi:saccharopine dehydrogenase-like NADP-dependent oxidoreductase